MQNPTNQQINHQLRLKKFALLVLIISAAALLLSAVFKIFTPNKEKVVINDFALNNYNDTQSTFKKVFYSGEKIEVPKTFNIYQTQNNTGLADELANKLINEYDLKADEKIPNYWIGEQHALAKNNYEHSYIFSGSSAKEGNDNLKIITDEAIAVCRNFYSKYNISVALLPQKEDIIYLDKKIEQSVVSKQEATFLQIPLTYELDGYQVFYENKKDYPFFCRVDNLYTLERVVFRDFFQDFQVLKQLPSISIDKAVEKIKNGDASIIDAESKIASTIDLNWINEADLYNVSIDYRFDEKLKIVYPFYKFKAKLVNSGGLNIEALIITPAIETAKEK